MQCLRGAVDGRARVPPNGAFWEDEDAEQILADILGLKKITKRDGKWKAEYFGGVEVPLADVVRRFKEPLEW
jgi:hypothetical protein